VRRLGRKPCAWCLVAFESPARFVGIFAILRAIGPPMGHVARSHLGWALHWNRNLEHSPPFGARFERRRQRTFVSKRMARLRVPRQIAALALANRSVPRCQAV
jgi:hypothetical protein